MKTKLPGIGTTIFTVMSKLAADVGAINLSQGYPDFNAPAELIDLLSQYMQDGYNQYPPMSGVEALRAQVREKCERLYGCAADAEHEITITSGATEAIFVAVQAMIHAGDDVIVLDPAYDSYDPAVTMAGGTVQHVPLAAPDFSVDWDRVRAAIKPNTRLLMVNSPHNPTATVFDATDLDALELLLQDFDLHIVSDEVYEHMVFDGAPHQSLLTRPALASRAFVISSFGKTYHATGWKVAYCVAPAVLTAEFRKVHQFVTFTTHTPTQWALATYMERHPEHYAELAEFYQAKRDLFRTELVASGFRLLPSAGTYFQLADYSAFGNEPDVDFVRYLTTEVKVAAIPVSVFYKESSQDAIIRFCFAKDDDTLREAASRLRGISR
jgi:methionine aminotransferase